MNLSPRRREEASKKALVAIKRRQKNEEITEKDKSPDELPWPLDNREPPDGMDELKHDKLRKPFWPVKKKDPHPPRDDDAFRHGAPHHAHLRRVNYHAGAVACRPDRIRQREGRGHLASRSR